MSGHLCPTAECARTHMAGWSDTGVTVIETGTGMKLRQSLTTRQGRKVPRMLYQQTGAEPADDDPIVGLVDTPEIARMIVTCVNEYMKDRGGPTWALKLGDEPCPGCGTTVCYHPPTCTQRFGPSSLTFDEFYKVFTAECVSLWDGDPPHRQPSAVTLLDGMFPGVVKIQNPITRDEIPVRRVPLSVTEADDEPVARR